jgi:hypothetical protein
MVQPSDALSMDGHTSITRESSPSGANAMSPTRSGVRRATEVSRPLPGRLLADLSSPRVRFSVPHRQIGGDFNG